MTNHNEVADVLDGAADVIERDGWHQGWLVGDDNSVCAMGAMGRTCGLIAERDWVEEWSPNFGRVDAARNALATSLGLGYVRTIPDWNDAPERTEQEVLDALRHAAKDQRRLADGIES